MLNWGYDEITAFSPAQARTTAHYPRHDGLAIQFNGRPARRLEAKEHVFCEGDTARQVYRVEAGLLCTYRMMSDGRRQVVDFAFPGDIVGLGAGSEHNTSAQAIRPTRLRCLPTSALTEAMHTDARLAAKLYTAVAEELHAARELLLSVCQRSAAERLAAFLVALVRRNERRGLHAETLDLGMTRTDIADFLGLTIETVSRTFTKFRTQGLIDIAQCTSITIVDRGGLEALAAGGGSPND
jgi:CRP/FNR family transcriptional regulator, anaerobic regulatory protein